MRTVVGITALVVAGIIVINLVSDNAFTMQGCVALASTWGGNQ